MRFGAIAIRFAAAASLYTAPAPPRSIDPRAPARLPATAPSFDIAARPTERSRQPAMRIDAGVSPGALAIALACFGAASTRAPRASRRSFLGVALASAAALPRPASASYALYSASQQSFDDRKKTGYVPVATNDRATLQSIQDDLDKKRPERLKRKVKAAYCAGNTSSVTPFLENACATFGVSKADQTTGRTIEEMTGQQTLPDYRRNLNN